jgi:hypothetical protein
LPGELDLAWPIFPTVIYSTGYARFDNRGITLKVLADELGVTAFYVSEIVKREGISDSVTKAIAERIGRDHRESFPAHNFSSPEWKTLKQLAYL